MNIVKCYLLVFLCIEEILFDRNNDLNIFFDILWKFVINLDEI